MLAAMDPHRPVTEPRGEFLPFVDELNEAF
jgi:hypothetical protein